MTTPSGVKRLMPIERSESARLLTLSWWFEQGRLAEEAEVDDLVVVLKANLPEALPRRYGSIEPPEFIYAEAGEDHFQSYVRAIRNSPAPTLVWYPHPPVAHVSLSIPERVGGSWLDIVWLCSRSKSTPAFWNTTLVREVAPAAAYGAKVSSLIRPFYGDVRTLDRYQRGRGRYWFVVGGTQSHPVPGWWWNGIPSAPAHAVVLGEPYLGLWPDFVRMAESKNGLAFVSAPSWKAGRESICQIAPIPEPIAQPAMLLQQLGRKAPHCRDDSIHQSGQV